jgi:hypothetical protein
MKAPAKAGANSRERRSESDNISTQQDLQEKNRFKIA